MMLPSFYSSTPPFHLSLFLSPTLTHTHAHLWKWTMKSKDLRHFVIWLNISFFYFPFFSFFLFFVLCCCCVSVYPSCVDWHHTKLDIRIETERAQQESERERETKTSYNFVIWKSFRFAGLYAGLMHFLSFSRFHHSLSRSLTLHESKTKSNLILWGNYEMKQNTSASLLRN